MIEYTLKYKWGGVGITARIDCHKNAPIAKKIGLAVEWAIENDKSLRGIVLDGANLSFVHLAGRDLTGAIIRNANLDETGVFSTILNDVDLSGSTINPDLSSAGDISGLNLRGAILSTEKHGKLALIGTRPFTVIEPIGSRRGRLVAYRTRKGVFLKTGCFFGSVSEFRVALEKRHQNNAHAKEYEAALEFIEAQTKSWQRAKRAVS